MDIVVCVKTNPDLQMIRIKNREPVLEAIPYKLGDLDKNALEAALQLRDAAGGGTVTALHGGRGQPQDQGDHQGGAGDGRRRGGHRRRPGARRRPTRRPWRRRSRPPSAPVGACDLLLFGEGSTDGYSGQVGSRVAELLGVPQIGYARKLEPAAGAVRAERSMDDMIETLEAPLPAAVTVVSEINEPRIPTLMNIMKAEQASRCASARWPTSGWRPAAAAPQKEIVSNLAEEQDRKHVLFEGTPAEQADALVNALVKEGVLGRS